MSMPKIPDITADINIERDDAINIIVASIAMEELAIAHILNAEGEKLQYVLGTLEGSDPGEVTPCGIMAVNKSIQKTLREVMKTELLLEFKLEDAIELAGGGDEMECRITIAGKKTWRDGNNVAKIRPPSVTIELLRDDKHYDSVDVDSTGDGSYTFECLPVRENSGHIYKYRINEPDVIAGYKKEVEGFNVINTLETFTINCTKTWSDDNDKTSMRPDTTTINLFRNGALFDSKEIESPLEDQSVSNFSFTVPFADDTGKPFVYSIDEKDVPVGYEKKVDMFNITNTIIRLTATAIFWSDTTQTELGRRVYHVNFGGSETVVAAPQPGHTVIPPDNHEFTDIRTNVEHTFHYVQG